MTQPSPLVAAPGATRRNPLATMLGRWAEDRRPWLATVRRWPRLLWRTLRHAAYANPLYHLTLKGGAPREIRPLAGDPWPGEARHGGAILTGDWTVGGHRVGLGETPWSGAADDDPDVHGFAWLDDLRLLGSPAAGDRARHLVGTWIAAHGTWSTPVWRPDILGRRLGHWLTAHRFLCTGADDGFAADCLGAIAMQARHLRRAAAAGYEDGRIFLAIKGLIQCGTALPGFAACLDEGRRLLEDRLERQVLPDGGHVERCPAKHLHLLSHLIDMRAILSAAETEAPLVLQTAIDRMVPMLRGLRLGDGGLAQFHGGGEEDGALIDAVLARAGVKARAFSSAPHSGFQRLAAGRTVIVIDTGAPPHVGTTAHAGCLSFEMSSGRHRLIVNCGTYPGNDGAWRTAMRSTASHSTLGVDDTSSATWYANGDIRAGPTEVGAERRQAEGNIWLDAHHDGYVRAFGPVHRRRLYLDAAGEDFRGEDRLGESTARAFAVRFHLHPAVQASISQDGASVLLKPPSGRGWRMQAAGGTLGLEESVYFGAGVRRRTEQIVISGPLDGGAALIKWRLSRLGP